MDVPDGMDVKVVENAGNCVHITMPAPPATAHLTLSDEELSNAAGGGCATWDHDYPLSPILSFERTGGCNPTASDEELSNAAGGCNGLLTC